MSIIQHDAQSNYFFYLNNGSINVTDITIPLGDWDALTQEETDVVGYDINVKNLSVSNIIGELVVATWLDGNTHRIAIYPSSEDKLYDPNTPYRLYYATDTRKLYQNIADTWQFVATQDHTNLLNAGNMTHDEIDETLNDVQSFPEVQWEGSV